MTTGRINQVRVCLLNHTLHKQLFPSFRYSPSTMQRRTQTSTSVFTLRYQQVKPLVYPIAQQFQNARSIPQGSQATLPHCTHNANPAAAHLQAQQTQESCYSQVSILHFVNKNCSNLRFGASLLAGNLLAGTMRNCHGPASKLVNPFPIPVFTNFLSQRSVFEQRALQVLR